MSYVVLKYRLAAPVVASYLSQTLLSIINVIYVGHLGPEFLGAAALATLFANVTGYSVVIGLCSALDTLASQANGAGNYKHVGLTLQRAIAINSVVAVVIAIIWGFSEHLLVLARQNEMLSYLAGLYIRLLLPGLPFFVVFECVKRYLQAQGIMTPILIIVSLSTACNALLGYLFIYQFGFGFIGAPISLNISMVVNMVGLLLYVKIRKVHERTWTPITRDVFRGWWEFLRLGIPGALMICLEWWCFELSALLAGLISVTSLAAQTLLMNAFAFVFMLPLGISVAAATRVGNCMGANDPHTAKLAARVCMFFGLCVPLVTMGLYFFGRHIVGKIFSDDEDVIAVVAYVLQVAFLFGIADGLQGVASGVLRGLGKQRLGMFICLGAFYLLGLPLGSALAFGAKWDIFGLWIGLTCGVGCAAVLYIIVIVRTQWGDIAKAVSEGQTQTQAQISAIAGDYEMMPRPEVDTEAAKLSNDEDEGEVV
eukprot:TRINITY_DN830_c0_g1_i1.p1 TRINITY_DN830_c0_g1~~TRINITY_DN830_c0_g1_i1.p1  ORF type:complete len:482 (+),score=95.33 TRINITY_DN830_c0_g1_i1:202-1647(+)